MKKFADLGEQQKRFLQAWIQTSAHEWVDQRFYRRIAHRLNLKNGLEASVLERSIWDLLDPGKNLIRFDKRLLIEWWIEKAWDLDYYLSQPDPTKLFLNARPKGYSNRIGPGAVKRILRFLEEPKEQPEINFFEVSKQELEALGKSLHAVETHWPHLSATQKKHLKPIVTNLQQRVSLL